MALNYVTTEPPLVSDKDAQAIVEWLGRELRSLEGLLDNVKLPEIIYTEPDKYEDGDIYYVAVTDAAFSGSPGYFARVSGAWQKL